MLLEENIVSTAPLCAQCVCVMRVMRDRVRWEDELTLAAQTVAFRSYFLIGIFRPEKIPKHTNKFEFPSQQNSKQRKV